MPSAFKQPVVDSQDSGGGLAPASTPPVAVDSAQPTQDEAASNEAGAKAAAEMLRQQEALQKREEAEAEARREQEAEAGAAAAAKLLKMQEEQDRKDAEALRKKMKLDVDADGQVVDPELQEEMGE